MANQPYEILIRGKDGEFSGAHVIDKPGDVARAIKPADWPAIVTGINNNAVAKATEADALKIERDALKAERDAMKAERDEARKPERQRLREALEKQLAEIQAQLDQLPA